MNIIIKGNLVDGQTRCSHYHSPLDIVAIKFKCCKEYYPCFQCHQQNTDHTPVKWKKSEFGIKAILCGVCKSELTIQQYLDCNNHCPVCDEKFNPGCLHHRNLYFEFPEV